MRSGTGTGSEPGGPLSPEAQRRRRRVVVRTVLVVTGLLALATAVQVGRAAGTGAVLVLLGSVLVVAVLSGLLIAADRGRRAATAPADPDLRANPPLDVERVRAHLAQGPAAAVREVRRQAPWLTLGEAAAIVDRLG